MAYKFIYITEDYKVAANQCGTMTHVIDNQYWVFEINISQMRVALGVTTNDLGALCTSENINKWAQYKPGAWGGMTDYMAALFEWVLPVNNFRLGDFIGYNHNAKPPVYYAETLPESIQVEIYDLAVIHVHLARGEAAPVAKAIGAVKTQLDVQTTWAGTLTHHRISVPSYGDEMITIEIPVEYNLNLDIKPFYYTLEGPGEYLEVSAIEDGFRRVALSHTTWQFYGIFIHELVDRTGGNPFEQLITWQLSRTINVPKSVSARLHVHGTGFHEVNYDMGVLSFAGMETKTFGTSGNIEFLSDLGATTTVILDIEFDTDNSFSHPQLIVRSSFVWTTPGIAP